MFRHALLSVLAAAALHTAAAVDCGGLPPPPPLPNFNHARYVGDWYVQRMWGTGAGSVACMMMHYSEIPGGGMTVRNTMRTLPYLNELELSGIKRLSNTSDPSKWLVFPNAGPLNIHPSPSWVAAVSADYQWSAVTAGPPSQPSALGCVPEERTGGMTIMTRLREPPADVLKTALASLALLVRPTCAACRMRRPSTDRAPASAGVRHQRHGAGQADGFSVRPCLVVIETCSKRAVASVHTPLAVVVRQVADEGGEEDGHSPA
jgi:hypothetical protein